MDWIKRQLELSRGDGSNLPAMEGLRGFAVFLVFVVHYVTLIEPWIGVGGTTARLARAMHAMGNIGVDLFFVLSGYLIYGALISKSRPFRQFLFRRIERIYPTFLAVFLIYLILSWAFPAESKLPQGIVVASVYLLQNLLLLPGLFDIQPMITVAWSLSYEMFYYLAIPIVISVFRLRNLAATFRGILFVAMGLGFAAYFAQFGGPVRLLMFLSGILLWEASHDLKWRAPGTLVALLGLGAALMTSILPIQGTAEATLKVLALGTAFFALCFTCFTQTGGRVARLFSWPPLRWLGNISYSYYLIHGLALKFLFMLFAQAWPPSHGESYLFPILIFPAFMFTLLPALGLFLFVERPLSLKPARAAINPLAGEAIARSAR